MLPPIFKAIKDVPRLRKARRSIAAHHYAEALANLQHVSTAYPTRPIAVALASYCHVAEGHTKEAIDCLETLRTWSSDNESFGDYADYLSSVVDSDRLRYFVTVAKYTNGATGMVKTYLPIFDFTREEVDAFELKSGGSGSGSFARPHVQGNV